MDPHDRLWGELIFSWCNPAVLLALRAVCRAFRAQLNDSRLWLPFTMVLPQLRYEERIEGWRGIVQGMQREAVTRANCDAGRFTLGQVLKIPTAWALMHVAGRIAAFCPGGIKLLDIDTGAVVGSLDVSVMYRYVDRPVVLDRYIAFWASGCRGLLLDCVSAQWMEFAPSNPALAHFHLSVSGACFSYATGDLHLTVVQVEGGAKSATTLKVVARLQLAHQRVSFALSQSGQSYLLFDHVKGTLQLVNLVTGQAKQAFLPPAGHCIVGFACFPESDFMLVDLRGDLRYAVVSCLSDGNCSKPFECGRVDRVQCLKGRVIVMSAAGRISSIDAVTGLGVWSATLKERPIFDSSGAVVFRGPDGGAFVSSGSVANGCEMSLEGSKALQFNGFRFGILVVDFGHDLHCVVRFDIPLTAEPRHKVTRGAK